MKEKATPKKKKNEVTSINEVPLTKEEIKSLQAILKAPHWKRRKLKDEFIDKYGRISEEVNSYIMSNGKRKRKAVQDESGSMIILGERYPKTVPKARKEESVNTVSGTTELRVPFKRLRIEGSVLVIEFDITH